MRSRLIGVSLVALALVAGTTAYAHLHLHTLSLFGAAVATTGTVLDKETWYDGSRRVRYEFFLEPSDFSAKPYQAWDDIDSGEFGQLRIGQAIPVLYLADDPTRSHQNIGDSLDQHRRTLLLEIAGCDALIILAAAAVGCGLRRYQAARPD